MSEKLINEAKQEFENEKNNKVKEQLKFWFIEIEKQNLAIEKAVYRIEQINQKIQDVKNGKYCFNEGGYVAVDSENKK